MKGSQHHCRTGSFAYIADYALQGTEMAIANSSAASSRVSSSRDQEWINQMLLLSNGESTVSA